MKALVTFMCIVLAASLAGGIFGISAGVTFTSTLETFTDSITWVDDHIVDPTLWVLDLFGIDIIDGFDDPYVDVIFAQRSSEDLLRFTECPDRDFSDVEYAVYIEYSDCPLFSGFSYMYVSSVDASFSADYFGFYFDAEGVLLYCIAYKDHDRMDAGIDVTKYFETSFLNVYTRNLVICLNTWHFPYDERFEDFARSFFVSGKEWREGLCKYYPSWWIFDWS